MICSSPSFDDADGNNLVAFFEMSVHSPTSVAGVWQKSQVENPRVHDFNTCSVFDYWNALGLDVNVEDEFIPFVPTFYFSTDLIPCIESVVNPTILSPPVVNSGGENSLFYTSMINLLSLVVGHNNCDTNGRQWPKKANNRFGLIRTWFDQNMPTSDNIYFEQFFGFVIDVTIHCHIQNTERASVRQFQYSGSAWVIVLEFFTSMKTTNYIQITFHLDNYEKICQIQIEKSLDLILWTRF